MKKMYLPILILMLVIGFAAVATNLVINGTINFGFNENDFDSNVIFTYTNTMYGDAEIINGEKSIIFNTTKLETVNEQSILKFDVTNKSLQYDASVTIECGLEKDSELYKDYIKIEQDLTNTFELNSGQTKTGTLTITLIKAYDQLEEKDISMACKLIATAKERTSEGTYTPVEHEYEEILLHGADPVLEATPVEGISLAAETNAKKLIPVTINEEDGTVTRADTTKEWYDYETKKWANAVILVDGAKDPGADKQIPENQIESYFVWIPKYRYRIFDMGKYNEIKAEGTELTNKTKPIDVQFGLENTVNKDDECETPGISGVDGTCEVGKWMTHPAFTSFGNIKGFWVGKFDTGYNQNENGTMITDIWTSEGAKKDSEAPTKVVIKPNIYGWRSISLANRYKTSFNYHRELDSHMMKNTEWGAVVYLSNSIYGICEKNSCVEIRTNNSNNYVTGVAAKHEPTTGYNAYTDFMETVPNKENEKSYVYPKSYLASTTLNNTGIFDMSGGVWKQVMGLVTSATTTEELSLNNIKLNNQNGLKIEDIEDLKYVDIYLYSQNNSYENRILGDATGELGPFAYKKDNTITEIINSWYQDLGQFANTSFIRGGPSHMGTDTGLFTFANSGGAVNGCDGFRIVLTPQ